MPISVKTPFSTNDETNLNNEILMTNNSIPPKIINNNIKMIDLTKLHDKEIDEKVNELFWRDAKQELDAENRADKKDKLNKINKKPNSND